MENPNTFAVCLGRQLGSGGHQIAKELVKILYLIICRPINQRL